MTKTAKSVNRVAKIEAAGIENGSNGTETREEKSSGRHIQITAPKFKLAEFEVKGNAVLVIHRFSHKTLMDLKGNAEQGKSAGSRKNREAKSTDDTFNQARYISKEGWDGFHAASIRNAMISVCRLVNFKMTLAKMSIFVIADGLDYIEPQIPLIRIYGPPAIKQEDMGRVANGNPYCIARPAYHDWSAKIKIRWDDDQFSLTDITNLLMRVGHQNGIGEGRPNSKETAGQGWGTFDIVQSN